MELIMSITKHFEQNPVYQFTDHLLKSIILPKIKLYGLPVEAAEKLPLYELCDIINTHEAEQVELSKRIVELAPNISEYPPVDMLKRMSSKQSEWDEYELRMFAQADKYKIPYSYENPDFCKIEDAVIEMENLEQLATNLCIYWDYNYYDPIGLQGKIDDAIEEEYRADRALHRYYNSTRLESGTKP